MQATAIPTLVLISIIIAAICGCTYYDKNGVTEFADSNDELNISESNPISLGEATDLFSEYSKEYLHRDPANSINKIIGIKVGTDGKAMNWILGTKVNDEQEYYEVSPYDIIPMIWEMPLPEDLIDTASLVDLGNAIQKTGDVQGERTVTIIEGKITITTKTQDEIKVSIIDAYTGDVVI